MQFLPLNLMSKRLHFLLNRFSAFRLLKCVIMTICDISGNLCQAINQQQYQMPSERRNCRQFAEGCWKRFFACRFLFCLHKLSFLRNRLFPGSVSRVWFHCWYTKGYKISCHVNANHFSAPFVRRTRGGPAFSELVDCDQENKNLIHEFVNWK